MVDFDFVYPLWFNILVYVLEWGVSFHCFDCSHFGLLDSSCNSFCCFVEDFPYNGDFACSNPDFCMVACRLIEYSYWRVGYCYLYRWSCLDFYCLSTGLSLRACLLVVISIVSIPSNPFMSLNIRSLQNIFQLMYYTGDILYSPGIIPCSKWSIMRVTM